jgi:hypothetical protein
MAIPGNLLTTAMAVMPYKDVNRALELALSVDVPFWPQLPHLSYYEDMYVQASEGFPGIVIDLKKRTLRFSMEKFMGEFEETMAHFNEPEYFDISETYSDGDNSKDPSAWGSISSIKTTGPFSSTIPYGHS